MESNASKELKKMRNNYVLISRHDYGDKQNLVDEGELLLVLAVETLERFDEIMGELLMVNLNSIVNDLK